MRADEVAGKIESLVGPALEEEALEVWGVEYKQGPNRDLVRIFIDSSAGVDLETCARVSGLIGPLLSDSGLLARAYDLEVSSPGLDRVLFRPRDYQRFLGSKVKVRTSVKIGDRRNFIGNLVDADDEAFTVDCDDGRHTLAYVDVSRANVVADIKF